MVRMGKDLSHSHWHVTCNSHTGNLLAKDISKDELIKKVNLIQKEFNHTDLDKLTKDQGGKRIALPSSTRWNSQRDAFSNLIENLNIMQKLHIDKSCTNEGHIFFCSQTYI